MALNCGDGTHSPVWIVTQVSSGASGRSRGGGTGAYARIGGSVGVGGGLGGTAVGGGATGAPVTSLDEQPPSASRRRRQERAIRIIEPHVTAWRGVRERRCSHRHCGPQGRETASS